MHEWWLRVAGLTPATRGSMTAADERILASLREVLRLAEEAKTRCSASGCEIDTLRGTLRGLLARASEAEQNGSQVSAEVTSLVTEVSALELAQSTT